jgi:hypothetical protein
MSFYLEIEIEIECNISNTLTNTEWNDDEGETPFCGSNFYTHDEDAIVIWFSVYYWC